MRKSRTLFLIRRIFVPLCGKTGDLLWLTKEKGHAVIGVEGVESVVKEFFAENSIECDRSELDGGIGAKFVASKKKRGKLYLSAEREMNSHQLRFLDTLHLFAEQGWRHNGSRMRHLGGDPGDGWPLRLRLRSRWPGGTPRRCQVCHCSTNVENQ